MDKLKKIAFWVPIVNIVAILLLQIALRNISASGPNQDLGFTLSLLIVNSIWIGFITPITDLISLAVGLLVYKKLGTNRESNIGILLSIITLILLCINIFHPFIFGNIYL
jgi:putative Mn2+ efflux pump MntP